MERDSWGELTAAQASETQSATLPQAWTPKILFTNNDARRLLARFVAVYGNWFASDAQVQNLIVREYVEHLGGYSPARVQEAASALIRTSKSRPTVADLIATIRAQREVTAIRERWCEDESKFCGKNWNECCGAPLTPVEIARRKEFCERLRKANPTFFAKEEIKRDDSADISRPLSEAEMESLKRLKSKVSSRSAA